MVDFHKLKNLGTDILGRAGDIAEQAKDKVAPLAEQAKDKVAPLAEQAKDKVGPLAGKAKDAAAKGVDKAAGGLDSATGHKYHHKLGAVTGNRDKNPTSSPAVDLNETESTGAEADLTPEDGASDAPPEAAAPEAAPEGAASEAAPVAEDKAPTAEPTAEAEAPEEAAADPSTDDLTKAETAYTDDTGHTPTPADMPQHRPTDNDPS